MTAEELKAYLDALPVDDEPLTDSDRQAIEEARRDIASGDVLTSAQLREALGLAAEQDSDT